MRRRRSSSSGKKRRRTEGGREGERARMEKRRCATRQPGEGLGTTLRSRVDAQCITHTTGRQATKSLAQINLGRETQTDTNCTARTQFEK